LLSEKVVINIQAARVRSNISQEQLAKYLGFKSRISIANIESAKQNIQLHTIYEIALYLNVPIIDLLPSNTSKEISKSLLRDIKKTLDPDTKSSERVTDFVRMVTTKKQL
jgi:transcriptional regulator with XRE-family HTH domain